MRFASFTNSRIQIGPHCLFSFQFRQWEAYFSYGDAGIAESVCLICCEGPSSQIACIRKKEKEKEEEEQLEQNAMANQENQEKAQRYERDGARNRSPRRHDDGIELQL